MRLRSTRPVLRLILPLAFLLTLPVASVCGQTRQSTPGDALFSTLESLDRQLFEAYNACHVERFITFVAEDVEFYHDRGGLTRGRESLVDSLTRNICGKTRRDLVPGTMEVHPMDGFGALQLGTHRFCSPGPRPCDGASGGLARFIHLWQHQDGVWRITRVISYDHAPAGR